VHDVEPRQHLGENVPNFFTVVSACPQPESNVVCDGEMREQSIVLEHDAHVTLFGLEEPSRCRIVEHLAIE
jgi:hypothetical protein